MTNDAKLEQMALLIGEKSYNENLYFAYLSKAKSKILNRLYPYEIPQNVKDVPTRYEELQIELAIVLFNESGAEGQSSHNENGVSRAWRSETQILSEITPFVGLF